MTTVHGRARGRRGAVLVGIAVVGLVLAACTPEPPPAPNPPAPPTTSTTRPPTVPPNSVCASLGTPVTDRTPTQQDPVAYVAVVEQDDGTVVSTTFDAASPAEKDAELDAIAAQGEVVAVEPDGVVETLLIDDPLVAGSSGQWWVARAGFEAAWALGSNGGQGDGVRVAILDTGVEAAHPDLQTTESGGNVAPGRNETDDDDPRVDSGTHGTHVAGIAGALDNTTGGIGGAPQITIVPVRVLTGSGGLISDVVAGVTWAANPALGNADVINLSLGSGSCSDAMYQALQYAVAQGVTVVAAAGNCGCSSQTLFPAAFSTVIDGVIAVTATTRTDVRASFSTYGSYSTIAAPGAEILSTVPADEYTGGDGYEVKNGTSMASPVVAAAAALLKAKCPAYTPVQIRNRLTATSLDLGAPGWDPSFGSGLVRADVALTGAC